jgi:hypothetical protein
MGKAIVDITVPNWADIERVASEAAARESQSVGTNPVILTMSGWRTGVALPFNR